jgi:hypothetical protein
MGAHKNYLNLMAALGAKSERELNRILGEIGLTSYRIRRLKQFGEPIPVKFVLTEEEIVKAVKNSQPIVRQVTEAFV